MRIRTRRFFVHMYELVSGNGIGENTVNLVQLGLIAGLENQVLCRVETDRAWNTHPTLNQETDGERDVSAFDAEMIQHSSSSYSVHAASLTIVTDHHVCFRFYISVRRVVIVLDQNSVLLIGQFLSFAMRQKRFLV